MTKITKSPRRLFNPSSTPLSVHYHNPLSGPILKITDSAPFYRTVASSFC